jgi:hypothetical protein
VFFSRKVRGFFNVARSPLPNYQIVDLESFLVIVCEFLKSRQIRLSKRRH